VDDASGHYTTGFFWGNNYWTGSSRLCRSIYQIDSENALRKSTGNSGLPFAEGNIGHAGAIEIHHENPPFFPRFGVLKVTVNETYTSPIVS